MGALPGCGHGMWCCPDGCVCNTALMLCVFMCAARVLLVCCAVCCVLCAVLCAVCCVLCCVLCAVLCAARVPQVVARFKKLQQAKAADEVL